MAIVLTFFTDIPLNPPSKGNFSCSFHGKRSISPFEGGTPERSEGKGDVREKANDLFTAPPSPAIAILSHNR